MKSDARNFFLSGNDAIYAVIRDMQNATETTTPSRTSLGWDAVAQVAKARLTSRQVQPPSASAGAGETFVKDVFACMTGIGPVGDVPDGAIASALLQGVFEVPGRSIGAGTPAGAYVASGSSAALANPFWGAQPNTSWAVGDYLVYGYPFDLPSYFIATNAINGTYEGFNLETIPAAVSDPWASPPIVGACVLTTAGGTGTTTGLIHDGAIESNISPDNLCALTSRATLTMSPTQQFFANLAKSVRSVFVPKPAYAKFDDEYSGGGPTSWSPNIIGSLTANGVKVTFTTQPQNTNLSDPPQTIVVKVEYFGTDNVYHAIGGSGVLCTLTIIGNNGVPSQLVGTNPVSAASNGLCTFSIDYTKAGTTYIQATTNIGGSANSQQFWIKNK